MRLENKVAIVTGGGNGIGAAICAAFANEGARVVVADIDRQGAEQVASSICDSGGNAFPLLVDITDPNSTTGMAATVLEAYGQIDVLVNNAGARIIKGLMQHSLEDWEQMLRINLTGPFLCAQAVLPDMVKRGSGNIINLASIASFMGRPNRCAYVAAKSGVLGLTRAMATDLAGKNIRVNAIAPGMIASPFNQSFAEASDTGPAWAEENLIGRWGQPDDITGAAVFLASEESGFVNGSEIKIEGGWLGARSRSGETPLWD
ncbi:SDR family NAD(P)-dependent oxidoreductase [Pelagibius sp. Alg239-R121]|uniref:SDR family NAD(P)-dependent oxidoreductase n=1 Tax=Pelagibius sp. Alg239-R121 TaxID=2993448 RepID=UPI0024A644F9|nr:glucose 1-dehydrogenase [Pelagibius sp. Alg239-R121]